MKIGKQFLTGCYAAAICILSGLAAGYSAYENILVFPAPVYIAATIFLFVISGIKLNGPRLIAYCFVMMAAYVLIFILTALIASDTIALSIITAGFGAMLSFKLVHYFIKKIQYDNWLVFFAGSFAMTIGMLLYPLIDIEKPIADIPKLRLNLLEGIVPELVPAFFLWNLFVGLLLFFTLNKPGTGPETGLRSDYWFRSWI